MLVEGWGDLPGHLVVISGPSGSGKSTLIRRVLGRPEIRAQLSVSATTREPRPGEREGSEYYFLDHDAFHTGIARGEFLEHAIYNGHHYGTPRGPVLQSLSEGRNVLLEIEVQGALLIRDMAPGALFVFIRTPDFRVLEHRLRDRGTEGTASLLRRLKHARRELAEAHWYDEQVVNDELELAVDRLAAVLTAHGCGG